MAGGNPGQTELFFSRGIGIGPDGLEIPILGGARLSGKVSDSLSVGLLNMQTEAVDGLAPANNFTEARAYRDLPNSSQIGAIFVNCAFRRNRSPIPTETDHLSEPATRDLES